MRYRLVFLFCIICALFKPYDVYAYQIAAGNVTDTDGNRCGSLYWTLESDGTFTVTGQGPGATYRPGGDNSYDRKCPWDAYRNQIMRVQFNCIFTGAALYHFEYGASINSWFINCVNLKSYSDIPEGVTDMSATFMGCSSLTECGKIPDTVRVMQYTFTDCASLKNPPVLPRGLTDFLRPMRNNEVVHVPAYSLMETFSGCTLLAATPDFINSSGVSWLPGTFFNCINLITIKNIPSNYIHFMNTFNNCHNVRGVLSIETESPDFIGVPFINFSQNNNYILFIKSPDKSVIQTIRNQSGAGFRGYIWDDTFTVHFDSNGGTYVGDRCITMEYGSNMHNYADIFMKNEVSQEYYTSVPSWYDAFLVPYREGLTFDGWFYDRGFNNQAYETDIVNPDTKALNEKNMTLYAKWADRVKPEINMDFLDENWRNKPLKVVFNLSDKIGGGLWRIKLVKCEGNREEIYYNTELADGVLDFSFEYTFGNKATKEFEGETHWKLYVQDTSCNMQVKELTLRFDYTKPVISTDIIGDFGQEKLFDDRNCVLVSGRDDLSGMGMLRVNPSDVQNSFIDSILTPVITEGNFLINYQYQKNRKDKGYVLFAMDRAGNYTSRIIITDRNISSGIRRIIPRGNYD